MPLAANNNLDELYVRQRLLIAAAERLERQCDLLGQADGDWDSRFILNVQSTALREAATRINASISDILERDLQR